MNTRNHNEEKKSQKSSNEQKNNKFKYICYKEKKIKGKQSNKCKEDISEIRLKNKNLDKLIESQFNYIKNNSNNKLEYNSKKIANEEIKKEKQLFKFRKIKIKNCYCYFLFFILIIICIPFSYTKKILRYLRRKKNYGSNDSDENCSYYYYYDSNNKYCCTSNAQCPQEYNKLIKNEKECINNCTNDDKYQFEYLNECYIKCPNGTKISKKNKYLCQIDCSEELPYEDTKTNQCVKSCSTIDLLNNLCILNNENVNFKDTIVTNFQNDILSGNMDSTIKDLIEGDKKDVLIQKKTITYTLTTTENQNNNKQNNISSIHFGECEDKLKDYYKINQNEPLLIFKIDVYEEGLLIPKIEYEVYDYKTKKKLNLSLCEDSKVDISIPVTINENNLFLHDSSGDFYNDLCFTYTSENGTDLILDDRKKSFVNNNLTLCEEDCEYIGCDKNTKKALCSCKIKIKLPLISEISLDKEKLYDNFINIKKILNMNVMKCYRVLFIKDGISNNYGVYTIAPIIIIHILLVILFYLKGYFIVKNNINNIIIAKMSKSNINKLNKKKKKAKNQNIINNEEIQNKSNGINNINMKDKISTKKKHKNLRKKEKIPIKIERPLNKEEIIQKENPEMPEILEIKSNPENNNDNISAPPIKNKKKEI